MESKEKQLKERSHRVINSQRCAGYLMYHGCRLIRTEPSHIDPRFNIFIFYNDEKVDKWITKFTEEEESKSNAKRKEIHNGEDRSTV